MQRCRWQNRQGSRLQLEMGRGEEEVEERLDKVVGG